MLLLVLFVTSHITPLLGEMREEGTQREIKSLRSLLDAKVNARQVTAKGSTDSF